MIIEVPGTTDERRVWQAIAHLQKVDRQMPKSVLEGILREMLEHYTNQGLLAPAIEKEMGSALTPRGIHLKKLELRALDVSHTTRRDALSPRWWEIPVEELFTADGFSVSLEVVARAHLAPEVDEHHGSVLVLRSTLTAGLQVELADLFQSMELETVLTQRESWSRQLLRRLTDGNFDQVLDNMHSEKIGPGHNAGLEALWVTEIKVKAREEAFRPKPRQRYGDPLAHFFFMAHGDPFRQRQPGEKEI